MPLTVADIIDIDTPLSHFEERLRKATDALTRE
jgi:hypothetical protein